MFALVALLLAASWITGKCAAAAAAAAAGDGDGDSDGDGDGDDDDDGDNDDGVKDYDDYGGDDDTGLRMRRCSLLRQAFTTRCRCRPAACAAAS
jgi:hypothetical protein